MHTRGEQKLRRMIGPWTACLCALLLLWGAWPAPARARRGHTERHASRAPRAARTPARQRSEALVIFPAPPDTQLTPPALLSTPGEQPEREANYLTRRQRRLRGIAPRTSLLWLDASVGAAYLRARRLHFEQGVVQSNTLAMAVRVGAGLRVEFLTLGAVLNHARFYDAPLSTGGIEVGLRVPLGRVEPSLRVQFGYAWEGDPAERNQAEIRGFALGGTLGLTLFLQRYLSMDLGFDTSIIAVAAHAIDLDTTDQESVNEARRKLERTSLARLSTLRLGFAGHY